MRSIERISSQFLDISHMDAMNNDQQILQIFLNSEALLKGHFILSSGLRSDTYIQCAKVLSNPQLSEKLCSALASKIMDRFSNTSFDLLLSPAMGGVIVGYELARQLDLPSIFCERVDGRFELRRGFTIKPGSRILVVEDVITTGKSSLQTFEVAERYGGIVKAEAALIDRSGIDLEEKLHIPIVSLLKIEARTFTESQVPDELNSITPIKPGSRR